MHKIVVEKKSRSLSNDDGICDPESYFNLTFLVIPTRSKDLISSALDVCLSVFLLKFFKYLLEFDQ